MALSKPEKKKDKLALTVKALIDWSSPEASCKKLLNDVQDYGVKLEDGITVNSIRSVHLLLSKNRVTERAFAIYSINFSPENLSEWTFSSGHPQTHHLTPVMTSKNFHLPKKNKSTKNNVRPKNNPFNVPNTPTKNNPNSNNPFSSTKTTADKKIVMGLSKR